MYIPNPFLMKNRAEAISFMRQYSFASIVTAKDNIPTATHLPFTLSQKEEKLVLTSHFAKANPQWKEIEENLCLVIFNEPHTYISPKHYEQEQNVPTWNYVAVHAYGQGKIITGTNQSIEALYSMINFYDKVYKEQWDRLSDDYKLKMVKGIVPFEITVTDIQAKNKLSQNKSITEQQRIIKALLESGRENDKQMAHLMNQNLDQHPG